jgi:aryl-alcohol dehydrogenase-like predicted oxidoreductase
MNSLGRIGLGSATFGREIDEATSLALMDRAWAAGIRHFDTAANYSAGASERIVGAWLASRLTARDEAVIATKMRPPFEANAIEGAIRASLERLRVERVDIFYLHQWTDELLDPSALAALDHAVRQGRVGALGLSNVNAGQLEQILVLQRQLGFARIAVVQNNHNFAVRDVDAALCAVCARQDIAIVSYSPLGAGFLTGKHRGGVEPGSRFEVIPGHQKVYFHESAWARLARLEELAARIGHPLPLLALAWAFRQPGIACTLIGGRSPHHIDQALSAVALTAADWWDAIEREDP